MTTLSIAPVSLVVPTSANNIYTVPASSESTVTLSMTNYALADTTISVWVVASGETRGDQHLRVKDYPLYAREPRIILDNIPLPAGTALWVGAGAATTVSAQVTGINVPYTYWDS